MYNLIVCFGLFVVIVLSVEQVAIVVGHLENVSKIRNCALFSNLSMTLVYELSDASLRAVIGNL